MAKAFCLIPEKVLEFKQALKDGTIDPLKLSKMTSEERNTFLKKIVGDDNATGVNSLFESKLLLKNQKAGYISWAKKVGGLTPEAKRDIFTKIEKLDKVLNPEDEKMFLHDLASTRLGTNVSPTEAKTIFELSKRVQEAKAVQGEDLTFNTDAERMAYGRSKIALTNYVNDIKEVNNRLGLAERLKPTNYLRNLSDVAGNAKSIKASMDNSAIFRQGWKTLWTNPLIWSKNASKTFSAIYKTFGGKKVMDELNADIISRPNYDRMVKGKLAIGTIEEAFPGTIAEKVPVLGRVYKASENAYTGFLYRQRADIFDKYLDIAKKSGINIDDAKELQPIASLVNSLTGRGNLGKYEGSAATLLNNVFFSPRLLKSQIDTVGHIVTGAGGSNFVRKQAALNLLKVVGGTAAVLAISDIVKPGSVEWDTRSADFGKIKIGNTRFDVSGGMAGIVTLASRLVQNSTKSSTTGEVKPLNTGEFGQPTQKDVLYNFFENKLAPVAAVIKDILKGQDFNGNKPTVETTAKNLFLPIGFSTYEELKKDPNSPNALVTMILDGLGIGANTYLPKPKKENSWIEKPTKAQSAFMGKVGQAKFEEANKVFNNKFESWQKEVEQQDIYKKLSKEKQDGVKKSARERIQDQVFKDYGFTYKEPKKTREDLLLEKELEKVKPKKVSKSLMDMLIPTASADEGLGGSTTTRMDFRTGKTTVEVDEGIISRIIKAVSSVFASEEKAKPEDKYAAMPDVKMVKNPDLMKELPSDAPEARTPVQTTPEGWKTRHLNTYKKVVQEKGISLDEARLVMSSENKAERETYANLNTKGSAAGTFDVGLLQINVSPSAEKRKQILSTTKNMSPNEANIYINGLIDKGELGEEAKKLKDPEYNISKGLEIYRQRLNNLKDPVLAIASYNLGAGGAVLDPEEAMRRANYVYKSAGLSVPETEFTKDPLGFVRKNMSYYKSKGLFK